MGETFEPGESYWLPLDQVVTGNFGLRDKIEGPELEELKQSMSERGQIQPVVVQVFKGTPTDNKVTLMIGHRRYRAARELGWEKIWCTPVYGHGDFDDLAKVLVENIQRQNLYPLEEARAIQKLTEKISFSGPGLAEEKARSLTQDEIAKGVGKRQQYISEMLQIASLTEEELATLPESGKLKKDKLLQLLKSRNFGPKTAAGRPSEPVNYNFRGNHLTFRGKVDFETDDLDSVIAKLEELLSKIRDKRSGTNVE